jgi:phage shock protein E
MKNQYVIAAIILVVGFVLWTLIKNAGAAGGIKIELSDAKKRLDTEKGIILLDVRTREEYLEKHIPKSTLIPVNVLGNEAIRKLPDKSAEIFVYCRSGSRSAMAVKILTKLGYTHIYNLGGIVKWPYETVSGNK